MTIRVHQAVYAEVRGGHGLRYASGDQSFAVRLAQHLDLPATAPAGADWSPYLSGFPIEEWYVIARTFRDPKASRPGMVFSHALIIPIDEIIACADLGPAITALITEPQMPTNPESFVIPVTTIAPPAISELRAAAVALVAREIGGPAVRFGIEGFDELVVSLWGQLWPEIRKQFRFRLSFTPSDLFEDPPPAIVCTPASLALRWQNQKTFERYTDVELPLAAAMLCGDPAGEPVREFATSICADVTTFGELMLLEQAYRYFAQSSTAKESKLPGIRLISRLSPGPDRGISSKAGLLRQYVMQIESDGDKELLPLRNMDLSGFSSPGLVWDAVSRWIEANQFPALQDQVFVVVVRDMLTQGNASSDWQNAVGAGFAACGRSATDEFYRALWRWVVAAPTLLASLWTKIGIDIAHEDILVRCAPIKLEKDVAESVMAYAALRGLYLLHGVAVAGAFSNEEAIRRQLLVEPVESSAGVRHILRQAAPAEILPLAVDLEDGRLIALATELVAKQPSLLTNVDMSKVSSRTIWAQAIGLNPQAWSGPGNAHEVFASILDEMVEGRRPANGLIYLLACTPLGNLTSYPRRAALWQLLGQPERDTMLRATASAWIKNADAGEISLEIEGQLSEFILADSSLKPLFGRLSNGGISRGVQIANALHGFDSYRFQSWLTDVLRRTSQIKQTDAEVIGRIVLSKRWQSCVTFLLSNFSYGRYDLRPALRVCAELIGFFDKLRFGLSAVSSHEKWTELARLAAQLYPEGPDDHALWARAGGVDADLMVSGSGISRWNNAISRLQHGSAPDIVKLLAQMRKDFPGNELLEHLAGDPDFSGKK